MRYLNLNLLKRLDGKCSNAAFCTILAGQRVPMFKWGSDPPDAIHFGRCGKAEASTPIYKQSCFEHTQP